MDDKLKNIFSQSECIPADILDKYVANLLSENEKHMVEAHTINCEICADELEGLLLINKSNITTITNDLNTLVAARVDELNNSKKKKIFPLIIRLSAAVIVLLLISTVVYYGYFQDSGLNKVISENVQDESIINPSEQQKVILDSIYEKEEDYSENANEIKSIDQIISQKTTVSDITPIEDYEVSEDIVFAWDPNIEEKAKEKKESLESDNDKGLVNASGESVASDLFTTTTKDARDTDKLDDNTISGKNEEYKVAELEKAEFIIDNTTVLDSKDNDSQLLLAEEAEVDEVTVSRSEKKEKENNRGVKASANKAQPATSQEYQYADNDLSKNDRRSAEDTDVETIAETGGLVNAPAAGAVNEQQNSFYVEGKIQYEAENYQQAAKLFEKVLISIPQHYSALYYSAISYIELNQPEKALINLNKVLMLPEGEFYNAAYWYKAKALILNDKPNEAKIILENIIENNTEYKTKATKALEELN